METLDGVLYVKGWKCRGGENLKHKLLGHPSVIPRLVMIMIMMMMIMMMMMAHNIVKILMEII